MQELAGRAGSVVALDPRTGAVKVMYANPGYDNNHPDAKRTRDLDLQPLDAGRLSAGLDVQGRDRDGGDRQRQVHAELDRQRRLAEDDLGRAAGQRPQPELRRRSR